MFVYPTAQLCYDNPRNIIKSFQVISVDKLKIKIKRENKSIAEDGFDPSTSGLHTPTVPLCCDTKYKHSHQLSRLRDYVLANFYSLQIQKKLTKTKFSRAWFRSIDLWVMGPARSHCATLLDTKYKHSHQLSTCMRLHN